MVSSVDDNFYLRSLLGEEVFLLPRGALNRTHLERGKAVLDQYAVIIILEHFEEQLVQLQENFQWHIWTKWSSKTRTTQKPKVNLAEAAMTLIRDHNILDIELYEHAVELAASLTRTAVNASETRKNSRNKKKKKRNVVSKGP